MINSLLFKRLRKDYKIFSKLWKHSKCKSLQKAQPLCYQKTVYRYHHVKILTDINLNWHNLSIPKPYSKSVSRRQEYMIKYVEEENEYFHRYLEENEVFKDYLVSRNHTNRPETFELNSCDNLLDSVKSDTFDFSDKNILTSLSKLSKQPLSFKNSLLKNESFHTLCKSLLQALPHMKNTTFIEAMTIVAQFNLRRAMVGQERNLRLEMAQTFDAECARRCSNWDVRSHLLAADLFYHFRSTAMNWSQFMPAFITFMSNNFKSLTNTELVMLMYHANLYRHMPAPVLAELTKTLHSRINDISGTDLGIICLGLFKSKEIVRNNALLDALIPQIKEMVTSADDVCLSAVMKFLQRTTHKRMVKAAPYTIKLLTDLQPKLMNRLEDADISTVLHIISMFENIHDISEDIIHEMCRKVLNEDIGTWRLKDIALLSKLTGNLSSAVSEQTRTRVFEKLSSEIQRKERANERHFFLNKLCDCLLGMSFDGFYPIKLIEEIFSEDAHAFFERFKLDLRRDLYHLSESVRIEVPGYKGPLYNRTFPPQSKKAKLSQWRTNEPNKYVSVRDVQLQQIVTLCSDLLGGAQYLRTGFLLKHYQTQDVEIQLNNKGCPIPVSRWNVGSNIAENQRIAVVLHGINAYYNMRRGDGSVVISLAGQHAAKGRQLCKLGYQVVNVSCHQFEEEKDKRDYLQKLMQESSVHISNP